MPPKKQQEEKCYRDKNSPTPKYFGLCARDMKVGKEEEGRYGDIYSVVYYPNSGQKRWKKQPSPKKSPTKKATVKKPKQQAVTPKQKVATKKAAPAKKQVSPQKPVARKVSGATKKPAPIPTKQPSPKKTSVIPPKKVTKTKIGKAPKLSSEQYPSDIVGEGTLSMVKYDKLLTGKTISHKNKDYNFVRLLGCGYYGCVFLGKDQNKNSYAIKVSPGNKDGDMFFEREVGCLKTVERMCGKDILCYIDSFSEMINGKKYNFIVTEYAKGYIPMTDYIRLPIFYNGTKKDADEIKDNIVATVKKLHESGIAHADLHLGNIMINANTKEIKLIDFGACSGKRSKNYQDKLKFDNDQIDEIYMELIGKLKPEPAKKPTKIVDKRFAGIRDATAMVDLLANVEEVKRRYSPLSPSRKEPFAKKANSPSKKKERNIVNPTEETVRYFEKTNQKIRKYNELLLGKTISHNNKNYTFTNFIGCGSFACVFLALDDDDNKYAIKVSLGSKNKSVLFEREVDCLKHAQKICGKDIVCYIDSFSKTIETRVYDFIVTEYAEGFVSLADFYNLSPEFSNFTNKQVEKLETKLQQILKALEENGIAHRDIASRNILYNPKTEEFRLIDFGTCDINNNKEWMKEDSEAVKQVIEAYKRRVKK